MTIPALVFSALSSAIHSRIAAKSSEKDADAGAGAVKKSKSELRIAGSKEVGMPSEYVLIGILLWRHDLGAST